MARTSTEDISTDITSSSSIVISSPVRSSHNSSPLKLNEADKEILKWAGKLELESCDLREKSSELIGLLKKNSTQLTSVISTLNEIVISTKKNAVMKLIKKLEKQLTIVQNQKVQSQNVVNKTVTLRSKRQRTDTKSNLEQDELEKLTAKFRRNIDDKHRQIIKSNECTQSMLFNVNKQLQDMGDVLLSMSNDLQTLSQRQSTLENGMNSINSNISRLMTRAPLTHKDLPSNGTTLDEDELKRIQNENIKASSFGPITRSRKQMNSMKNDVKFSLSPFENPSGNNNEHRLPTNRDISLTRTIIPWNELIEDKKDVLAYSSEL
ncbi:Rec107p NDAI_0C03070 [Naumovozyma dairenensis CBS 421]|uniref:Uncharacterized protein n=1 Tax=Naumovozyma dairenensis (strain ATCC 10597 / BCRC 20456 / CBS 421 / NBRC 0211 / NRRL Y-12639) TaxID=1071378 RepID=G0W856_NAUDC|nr:hypothetical protein NDAI_0C03070 [Naumovozyma dairenensis CBS 421]CCD23967.1 hypothetical protein NDAI_0C03070 [Naumovozyma dairenensis CBS 421]